MQRRLLRNWQRWAQASLFLETAYKLLKTPAVFDEVFAHGLFVGGFGLGVVEDNDHVGLE